MRSEVGAIEANCTDSVDNDGDGTVNDGCARYILSDHLGSTSTIVDRNGATATVRYWPYGATRSTSGTVGTDKLYTGQQQEPDDPALGLYNYKARFYSTTLGRFASADTSAVDGVNRFSYAVNNPLRYTDPSGHCVLGLPCESDDAVNWFKCALTCDSNWIGEMARSKAYWDTVWGVGRERGGTDAFGRIAVAFSQAVLADSGKWSVMTDWGWQTMGAWFGVAGEFFEASLYSILFDAPEVLNVLVALQPETVPGAYAWWYSAPGFGYSKSSWEDFMNLLPPIGLTYSRPLPTLQSITIDAAVALDVDEKQLPWTDQQMEWLKQAGYNPSRPDDWEEIWENAVEATPDLIGVKPLPPGYDPGFKY